MSQRGRSQSPQPKLTDQQQQGIKNAQNAIKKKQQTKTKIFNQYGTQIVIGIFVFVVAVALFITFFSGKRNPNTTPVNNQEEIDAHNIQNFPYNLGANEFYNQYMITDAKKLFNTQMAHKNQLSYCATQEDSSIIPDKYNFRDMYPGCAQPVWNQGNCSSSYAVAAASTIADRLCKLKGSLERLSPQPLLSCDKNFTLGCEGGYVSRSFDYAKRHGLVNEACLAYTPENLENDCENAKKCDKFKIQDQCVAAKEEGIKRQIYQNGPVISVVPMFRDFLIYKDGIYHVYEGTSRFQGAHALKIIGWDTNEAGINYWIVENSWGESWGENGFARIATKQNLLFLEEYAIAPLIEQAKKPEDAEPAAQQQEQEAQHVN